LRNDSGHPIVNDGLWTLTFGEKATPQVLYFTTV